MSADRPRKPSPRKPVQRTPARGKASLRKPSPGGGLIRRVARRPARSQMNGARVAGLDVPVSSRRRSILGPQVDPETFGRWSERFARFMGTAWFIVGMTAFVVGWLLWNTLMPEDLQFDPKTLNFTLLTLILSLQASYAAPLILLAQNRQADRDRVSFEQDRNRAERGLADTEYLAREMASLRIALGDVATRDFVRSELRSLLEELSTESRKPDDSFGSSRRSDRPTETR